MSQIMINTIKIITAHVIGYILSIFIKRESKFIALGCCVNNLDMFMHNTKYIFLYLKNTNYMYRYIWLTNDEQIIKKLKLNGYKNVYKRISIYGLWYALKAKIWLYDYSPTSVTNKCLCYGATKINLWHGIPLKKIGFDDINSNIKNLKGIQKFIYNLLTIKDSYYNVNSEQEKLIHETAFLAKPDHIKILGSPRLDALYKDFEHQDLFMEKDFAAIKEFKNIGKNIIIYMPTFRDSGKDISGWLKSNKLKQFLKNNNAVLVCKLHPFDKNSLDFELSEEFYKMDSESDIYPVLKYSDALITDYSSIAYDYLLLDKPIIYHVPDLEEYQEKCRGFYIPYSEFAVGEVTRSEDEIISAMQNVINGIDNFKDERKFLRDKMFKYQDGRNCERVIEWIKSLD